MSAYNRLLDEDTMSLRDIARDLDAFARWAVAYLGSECGYDHHRYCQSHALDAEPCPVAQVVATLAVVDSIEGYE